MQPKRVEMDLVDFFDIKPSKKVNDSKNRYNIQTNLKMSYQQSWETPSNFVNDIAELASGSHSEPQASVPPTGHQVKLDKVYRNLEVKSKRKNTAKLLQQENTTSSNEGRSVVNIALENYYKRIKIKTLNEVV